ncbi:hypothetical protein PHISCL_02102 [Aspergillus sclerotialis]|uniref:Capsule polysaccharide biosynthesis protein n=1 Tax=Aspergillus sclerotialis TaxID=2070753 RepID=A0A3A2ZQW7_9EURO|nr:hypothetical protein PHISCL_02102 [Aspergillus sclerotialis]
MAGFIYKALVQAGTILLRRDLAFTLLRIIQFILSIKVFPLAWHIRNYYSYVFQYMTDKRPIPESTLSHLTLFQPTIWTSTTPLGEIDIMGHKSNSTYFTDCDAARSYHMCSLFREGLRSWSKRGLSIINPGQREGNENEPFYPAVGAVGCSFRKAILPGQRYDIATQILSWDEKWVYFISYFVQEGAFNPIYFSDRPKNTGISMDLQYSQGHKKDSAVLAISIACVVFKKGRKTVPPTHFFQECGCLPRDVDGEKSKLLSAIEERRLQGIELAKKINCFDQGLSLFDIDNRTAYAKF